jgi:hypothetical protein
MVSDKVFTTDGTQTIFSSDFEVISEDHIRVFFGSTLPQVQSRDDYDLINNAAVFHTAPTIGLTLTVQVGTTPTDILSAPTDAGIVAFHISEIQTVAENISDVNALGDLVHSTNEYTVDSVAPTSPTAGDRWFDTTTDTMKHYNSTAWIDTGLDSVKLATIETSSKDDQTGSEIKTLYESEADTNAYTDAEKSKAAAITATSDELNSLIGIEGILDDDSMTSATDTTLATSESIKAYVDFFIAYLNGLIVAPIMPRVSPRVCIWEGSNGTISNGIYNAPTVDRQQYTMTPSTHFGLSSGTFLKIDFEWQCVSAEDGFVVGDVLPFDNTMHVSEETSWPIWHDNGGDFSNSAMRVMFRVGDYGANSDVFHLWTRPNGTSTNAWYQKVNFALYARIYYTL